MCTTDPVVRGRVQGVGFRYFTERAAVSESISGWVRNLPDGSVEVEAHGQPDAMERFERAIRMGPAGSRVSDVETTELSIASPPDRFHVR